MTEKEAWQIVLDAAVGLWALDTRNMQLRDAIELVDRCANAERVRETEERVRKTVIANFIKAASTFPTMRQIRQRTKLGEAIQRFADRKE